MCSRFPPSWFLSNEFATIVTHIIDQCHQPPPPLIRACYNPRWFMTLTLTMTNTQLLQASPATVCSLFPPFSFSLSSDQHVDSILLFFNGFKDCNWTTTTHLLFSNDYHHHNAIGSLPSFNFSFSFSANEIFNPNFMIFVVVRHHQRHELKFSHFRCFLVTCRFPKWEAMSMMIVHFLLIWH